MRKSTKKAASLQYSLTELVIDSILDKKGEEVVHLDLTALPDAVSDHFIICHADSTTQVRAIGNHIVDNVFDKGSVKPFSKEGFDNAEWIIIDYMDVVAVPVMATPGPGGGVVLSAGSDPIPSPVTSASLAFIGDSRVRYGYEY